MGKFLKVVAGTLSAWLFMMLLILMAVDALELEATGDCRDCVILSR